MNAEIIAIGTEILIGDILNTNTHYLSRELAGLGISVFHHTAVGDNYNRMKEALQTAINRCDIVITTGGLGPTADDITVQVVADIFNKKVVINQESLDNALSFFEKRGIKGVENAGAQCEIVEGATVLINKNGLAPGSVIEEKGKTVVILPGPPEEMKNMWLDLAPILQKKSDTLIVSKTINMAGIGESAAETVLQDIIQNQTNPTIAPYAKSSGGVTFRITANARTEAEAHALIAPLKEEVYARLGKHIFGEDSTTLEEALVSLLIQKGLTISLAESITGGMVIARLINVSGASQAVKEGLVTYSNESKVSRGLVPQNIIDTHGAVSEEAAYHMALNVAKTAGTNIGISTTGFAETDVPNEGYGYFGICINGNVSVRKFNGLGTRDRVRRQATTNIIEILRKEIVALS